MIDETDQELTAVGSKAEIAAALAKKMQHQRPWLVVVSGTGNIGKTYRLESRLGIGRSPQCQVHVDEDGVSRRHAQIELTTEGNVQIVDLESRNGTFVNGAPVSRVLLRDGDKIQIGGTTILKFSYQDELDEALQKNLYESATRDPLTHAVNKRGFTESLAKEFAFAHRHGRLLSVIAFDVDHFKRVNDTHGHSAGDYVLERLAAVVAASIRGEDLFARIGGEEFAIVLRDIGLEGAFDCAERIRRTVEQTAFQHADARIPVTISSGAAVLDAAVHARPEALVQAADRALYVAKKTGRNRVCKAETETLKAAG
jgi:two-component system cell cycle response regulator